MDPNALMHDPWLWYLKGFQGILNMIQEFSESTYYRPPVDDRINLLEVLGQQAIRLAQRERDRKRERAVQ